VWSSLIVLVVAAALAAGAAFWVLRAYRRAGGGARSPRPALIVCVVVALTGLGVYLAIGRPELPDAPYAERIEALKQRDRSTYGAEEWLAVLAEDARQNPRDPAPYFFQGEILLAIGRHAEAARAFDSSLRRDPQLTPAMMGLGRAIVAMEGRVTPDALALFRQVSAVSDDPAPWIYQAWAAMEARQDADARRFWGEALRRMAPDDPRRQMAQEMASGRGVRPQ
jgi:cytochrome c-type biogenesis protein CcmH